MQSSASSCQSSHSSASCLSLGRHRSRNDDQALLRPVPGPAQRLFVEDARDLVGVGQHVGEELFLGVEVVVQQPRRDPGGLGDTGHPDLRQSVAHDALGGRSQDPVARLGGGQGALVGLLGDRVRHGRSLRQVGLRNLTVQSVSDARLAGMRRQGSGDRSLPQSGPGSATATGGALDALFDPGSITVVGASDDSAKWGHILSRRAIESSGERPVLLVNRRGAEVLGPAYPSHAGGGARPPRGPARPRRGLRAGQ